jgi:hypothetical protein
MDMVIAAEAVDQVADMFASAKVRFNAAPDNGEALS